MSVSLKINFKNGSKSIKIDLILIAILFFSTILRLYNIGLQSPWLDELSTFQVSDPDLSFFETHTLVMTREGFPHFYFLCLKYLSSIFGHNIVTLRMFSVAVGILSVYLMYLIVKEFINKRIGYIAAILIAVNGFHIYHSQEARTYSLLVFLILLATYSMVKYIKFQNWKNAILLGISCGLIPNAHPLGVLNVAVIYLTLLVFLLINKDRKRIFMHLLLSGIIAFIVFIPVIQIINKVGKVALSWILPPSYQTIKQAFFELLGSNEYILIIYILSVFVFFVSMIYKLKTEKSEEKNRKNLIFISLITFWILINIGAIILKSYLDISIIVNRYFIGSFPLFIITLAYCFSLIKNKYLVSFLIILFAWYSLHSLINKRNYYESISKSEWNKISSEIIKNNSQNHRIYSAYGFTSNILFKNTNCYTLLKEITFENYIESLKSNAIDKESFWYFDGNFRPYALSQEYEKYLNENFDLVQKIEKYDCWARHYILKNDKASVIKQDELFLKDFIDGNLDNQGNLIMFENGTIISKELNLEEGEYELTLNGNSLPEKPINGENAHIVLMLNNIKIWDQHLSEKIDKKEIKFIFKNPDRSLKRISITFDNDLSINNLDRNLIIYSIKLKKV